MLYTDEMNPRNLQRPKLPGEHGEDGELQAKLQKRLRSIENSATSSNTDRPDEQHWEKPDQGQPIDQDVAKNTVSANPKTKPPKPVPKQRNISANKYSSSTASSNSADRTVQQASATSNKKAPPTPVKPKVSPKPVGRIPKVPESKAGRPKLGRKPSLKPRPSFRKIRRKSSVSHDHSHHHQQYHQEHAKQAAEKDKTESSVRDSAFNSAENSKVISSQAHGTTGYVVGKETEKEILDTAEQRHECGGDESSDMDDYDDAASGDCLDDVNESLDDTTTHCPKIRHINRLSQKKRLGRTGSVVCTKAKKRSSRSSRGSARNSKESIERGPSSPKRKGHSEWETDDEMCESVSGPSKKDSGHEDYEPVEIKFRKPRTKPAQNVEDDLDGWVVVDSEEEISSAMAASNRHIMSSSNREHVSTKYTPAKPVVKPRVKDSSSPKTLDCSKSNQGASIPVGLVTRKIPPPLPKKKKVPTATLR